MPQLRPYIPETVTVHLGPPDAPAENVTVSFTDYIKNAVSSEIYPTWPEDAIRANIYAIVTFTLNRIFTEWYRSRGYDFDITNSTQYDQAFSPGREIYENIAMLVDRQFNEYAVKEGSIEPYFTRFCNGTTSRCDGLSQWGTVDLAQQGKTPLEILQTYYGEDLRLIRNAPVQNIALSYPGVPLRLGDSDNEVKIIQTQLNRIAANFPAIPTIQVENGVFGPDTQESVRRFQSIFNLPVTGEVDKATWYKIKQLYVGVKSLSDLISEGISEQEATLPYGELLPGESGPQIRVLQYYLNVIAYFNPLLNLLPINGVYDETTRKAVEAFQQAFSLPVTGEVDPITREQLRRVYLQTLSALEEGYTGGNARLYPGYFLSEGMSGQDVSDLQTYLSRIGRAYPEIPEVAVTGIFDEATRDAVLTLQRLFGLPLLGSVGPVTWNTIAREYDFLRRQNG